jgi:hypothetical protein
MTPGFEHAFCEGIDCYSTCCQPIRIVGAPGCELFFKQGNQCPAHTQPRVGAAVLQSACIGDGCKAVCCEPVATSSPSPSTEAPVTVYTAPPSPSDLRCGLFWRQIGCDRPTKPLAHKADSTCASQRECAADCCGVDCLAWSASHECFDGTSLLPRTELVSKTCALGHCHSSCCKVDRTDGSCKVFFDNGGRCAPGQSPALQSKTCVGPACASVCCESPQQTTVEPSEYPTVMPVASPTSSVESFSCAKFFAGGGMCAAGGRRNLAWSDRECGGQDGVDCTAVCCEQPCTLNSCLADAKLRPDWNKLFCAPSTCHVDCCTPNDESFGGCQLFLSRNGCARGTFPRPRVTLQTTCVGPACQDICCQALSSTAPTDGPTGAYGPSPGPSSDVTEAPSQVPTDAPAGPPGRRTRSPTAEPTGTDEPTGAYGPSPGPSSDVTEAPSQVPTDAPAGPPGRRTRSPTPGPTPADTDAPSPDSPTTSAPAGQPTSEDSPTGKPSGTSVFVAARPPLTGSQIRRHPPRRRPNPPRRTVGRGSCCGVHADDALAEGEPTAAPIATPTRADSPTSKPSDGAPVLSIPCHRFVLTHTQRMSRRWHPLRSPLKVGQRVLLSCSPR